MCYRDGIPFTIFFVYFSIEGEFGCPMLHSHFNNLTCSIMIESCKYPIEVIHIIFFEPIRASSGANGIIGNLATHFILLLMTVKNLD